MSPKAEHVHVDQVEPSNKSDAADQPIVRVHDVHKVYRLGERRVEALRGASMEIASPGFYAVMGSSGSGKSTLLHLIAGLDQPDSGEILINGRALQHMSDRELTLYRRRDVGMVFQQFNLIPTLSALDNAVLPGLLDGMRRNDLLARGRELLESLGVLDRADHRPDALSGGEQQRVAIARALFFAPRLLLADEPTGNLDSQNSDQLWALLRQIASTERLTVLTVTHEPSAARQAQRVFVLRDGVIEGHFDVEDADPAELATRYQQLVSPPR